MRYFKQIRNGYILAIGTGTGWTEITEEEYGTILDILHDIPKAEGKGYRLKTDLTWEEYDMPEAGDPEVSPDAVQAALEAIL